MTRPDRPPREFIGCPLDCPSFFIFPRLPFQLSLPTFSWLALQPSSAYLWLRCPIFFSRFSLLFFLNAFVFRGDSFPRSPFFLIGVSVSPPFFFLAYSFSSLILRCQSFRFIPLTPASLRIFPNFSRFVSRPDQFRIPCSGFPPSCRPRSFFLVAARSIVLIKNSTVFCTGHPLCRLTVSSLIYQASSTMSSVSGLFDPSYLLVSFFLRGPLPRT